MFRNEVRGRVYDFIQGTPGTHMRETGRRLGMSLGHLRYHLSILEKKKLIVSVKNGHYTRYFAKKDFDVGSVNVFIALRQANTRRIILHLINHKDATHKDLLKAFDFPPSTLSLYLDNLTKKKVVERTKSGRTNVYRVIDKRNMFRILRTYKASFLDRLVDKALEIYEETHL